MSFGHSSLVRRPSSSLKEKLMVRIESHRDSMDILKKVLRINKTRGKTVREVIAFAEERDGELFLDTWRFIFVRLSLRKDFEKLVDADHWPLTNPIKTLEGPLQDQHTRKAYDNTHERSLQENSPYSNKPEEPLSNKLKETRLNNLKVSRLETQKTRSSSKNWPDWSLPPPSEDNPSQETWKETTMEMRDDKAGERDVSSDGQNLQEFWNGDSSLSSPAPLPSQLEQFAAPGTSVTEKEEGRSLTWQIDSDHENCSLQLEDQNGQNLQENRRMSRAPLLSLPAHVVRETMASHCQQASAPDNHSGSASQIDTIPSLYLDDSRTLSTGTRPVTPEGANKPVGSITVHQLHLNPVAGQENDVVGETGLHIADDPEAREYQGAIPKRSRYQPSHNTVKYDVRQELFIGLPGNESNLNLSSILAGNFRVNYPHSSSPPSESSENAARNSGGCEILWDSSLQNENQDTGFFSEEGNSRLQMTSLSTTPVDTPTSGHEGVQYQISASSLSILEGGKTKHQIQSMTSLSNKQLDHFEIVLARPNTPEGAQPDINSPSLVTGRHINRPNQTDPVEVDVVLENGQGIDGAVEHYDATENNGLLEETKQKLESSEKSVLYLTEKLREKESCCQTIRADLFQSRQTLKESRQQCANLKVFSDHLQEENQELRRSLEELQHLSNRILEDNRRLWLLVARRASDVAFEGSSATVEEDNASDRSRIHQMDQGSECSQTQIANLRRESQELSEDLNVVEAGEESDDGEEVFEDALDHL